MNPRSYGSYAGELENVRKYISNRMDWMDKKLSYTPKTNIPEFSNLSSIIVYSQTNSLCFEQVSEPVTIRIADIAGRVILSKTIRENTSVAVAQGVYIVTVSDAQGHTKTVKCLVK